jgi:hypothetical protein
LLRLLFSQKEQWIAGGLNVEFTPVAPTPVASSDGADDSVVVSVPSAPGDPLVVQPTRARPLIATVRAPSTTRVCTFIHLSFGLWKSHRLQAGRPAVITDAWCYSDGQVRCATRQIPRPDTTTLRWVRKQEVLGRDAGDWFVRSAVGFDELSNSSASTDQVLTVQDGFLDNILSRLSFQVDPDRQ